MKNVNYFFTPVGPEYTKKFARNFGIAILILFAFYGIWSLASQLSVDPEKSTFLSEYPQIPQNDRYCWTQWFIEPTEIDEIAVTTSIQKTITGFGSDVDIPDRKISVSYHDENTIITVSGSWTEDKIQHEELTNTIKNYINDSKILRDDIILCS